VPSPARVVFDAGRACRTSVGADSCDARRRGDGARAGDLRPVRAAAIGQRTKEALGQASERGSARSSALVPQSVIRRIQRQRARGDSFRKIADDVNDADVPTAQGGAQWYAATVRHFSCGRRSETRDTRPPRRPPPRIRSARRGLLPDGHHGSKAPRPPRRQCSSPTSGSPSPPLPHGSSSSRRPPKRCSSSYRLLRSTCFSPATPSASSRAA